MLATRCAAPPTAWGRFIPARCYLADGWLRQHREAAQHSYNLPPEDLAGSDRQHNGDNSKLQGDAEESHDHTPEGLQVRCVQGQGRGKRQRCVPGAQVRALTHNKPILSCIPAAISPATLTSCHITVSFVYPTSAQPRAVMHVVSCTQEEEKVDSRCLHMGHIMHQHFTEHKILRTCM